MEYLQTLEATSIFLGSFCIILFTGIGLLPGHNDIFTALLVLNRKKFEINLFEIFCIYCFALMIAEFVLFIVSKKYGNKILRSKWVSTRFSLDQQNKVKEKLSKSVFLTVLGLRMMPMFRPLGIISTCSFDLNLKDYYKHYLYVLPLYSLGLIGFFSISGKTLVYYFDNYFVFTTIVLILIWIAFVRLLYSFIK